MIPAFVVVCLGIVYGSLFPFRFEFDLHPAAVSQFLASWRKVNSLGDDLGNVALFFPFGYIAYLIFVRSDSRSTTFIGLVVLTLTLSLGCQTAQLFTPGRDPSLFDLCMNLGGVTLGWIAGRLLPLGSHSTFLEGDATQHVPLVIVAAWIASQLLPLVPSIDLQSWKDALKPLILYPHFQIQSFLLAVCAWTTVLHLLEKRVGLVFRVHYLLLFAMLLLGAKVLIVANYLNLSETLGLLVAVPLWPVVGRRLSGRVLGMLLFGAFVMDALSPLTLRARAQDFGWIPFGGYLQGSMLINATALMRKLFVFGSIALLLVSPGRAPLLLALAFVATLVVVEILQRWIGYGTPALTDPCLFLALAWFIQRRVAPTNSRLAD